MNEVVRVEMMDEGDESGPGGSPPPPRCQVCGKLLADCNGDHPDQPGE